MTAYKGYYIDHVHFNTKEEIDNFIKNMAIEAYKSTHRRFMKSDINMWAVYMDYLRKEADRLHTVYGIGYDEIEQLEIEVMEES